MKKSVDLCGLFVTLAREGIASLHHRTYTLVGSRLAAGQFYESALNDRENAFRNIMKTHETKCTKTHGKSPQKRMDKVYESASI